MPLFFFGDEGWRQLNDEMERIGDLARYKTLHLAFLNIQL